MSNEFWNDGDDSDEVTETNAMKVLREKAEADSQRIREMSEQIQKLLDRDAQRELDSVVKEKTLPPKVVALAKAAGVKDSEGLNTFLTEYGDVFATAGSGTTDEGDQLPGSDDGVPADEQGALSTMAGAAAGSVPAKGLEAVEASIKNAESAEDLLKVLGVQG